MSLSGMGCFRRRSAATAIATTALLLGLAAPADGAVAIIGSPRVDFIPVAVCIAGIVAFTIIFEIALESLEHKLEVRCCSSRSHPRTVPSAGSSWSS
jgi:hypothetical protein